jgi:hypothetical protein
VTTVSGIVHEVKRAIPWQGMDSRYGVPRYCNRFVIYSDIEFCEMEKGGGLTISLSFKFKQ